MPTIARLDEQGATLAIISQNHHAAILPILDGHDLLRFIPAERVFDRTRTNGGDKRKPETYRTVQQAMPNDIRRIWMLEDTPYNLPAAAALCVNTVLIGDKEPTPEDARYIYNRAPTVPDFLTSMLENPRLRAA